MPRARPIVDGVELRPGLLRDPKGRAGVWRLRLPDGRYRMLRAETPALANVKADEILGPENPAALPALRSWDHLVEEFILYRQDNDQVRRTENWRNRKYALRRLSKDLPGKTPASLTTEDLARWWSGLSRASQDLRRGELRRLFNWAMLRGWFKQFRVNPIDLLDKKPAAPRQRQRLTVESFKAIRRASTIPALGLAMDIGLLTGLRRGDICALRWDDVADDVLRVTVQKSRSRLGEVEAARLAWDLRRHSALRTVLNRCRELAFRNRRCPFVLSHWYERHSVGLEKTDPHQVTPDMLSRWFTEASKRVIGGQSYPTFHEIRSLASALLREGSATDEEIAAVLAHRDSQMTRHYLGGHEFEFQPVDLVVPYRPAR